MSFVPEPEVSSTINMVSFVICDVEAVIVASLNSSLSPINSLSLLIETLGIDSLSSISKLTSVPEEAA